MRKHERKLNKYLLSNQTITNFSVVVIEYKQHILRGFVVAIEASASAPWFEFADAVVGIDRFGMSGDGDVVYSELGFNVDAIVADIKEKIK